MKDLNDLAPGLDNAGQPLEDLLTAGQPTKEHFERLAASGYRTVIDLRELGEPRDLAEDEAVRATGMQYTNIPVGHDTVDGKTFERFRRILKNPENRPVLVHCSSANRVGALLIPYLVLDEGKTTKEATEIAAQVGLKSGKLERAALRYVRAVSERRHP